MEEKLYHPLSDLGRIKEDLLSLFSDTDHINRLSNGFFDIPYAPEAMTDKECAVFVETCVTALEGTRIKEVALDISVVCNRASSALSEENIAYYHSLGIYGNRVDCLLQTIHSLITDSDATEILKKNYCIGSLTLISENPIENCDTNEGLFGKHLHYSYRSFCHSKK